jgi:hypothetical protein
MTKEPVEITTMRDAIKIFMRSLGVLEGKKHFAMIVPTPNAM